MHEIESGGGKRGMREGCDRRMVFLEVQDFQMYTFSGCGHENEFLFRLWMEGTLRTFVALHSTLHPSGYNSSK